jgi:hypothetical protein
VPRAVCDADKAADCSGVLEVTGVSDSRGRLREISRFARALKGRSWVWREGGLMLRRGRVVVGVELERVELTLDWGSDLLGAGVIGTPLSAVALWDAFSRECVGAVIHLLDDLSRCVCRATGRDSASSLMTGTNRAVVVEADLCRPVGDGGIFDEEAATAGVLLGLVMELFET